MNRLFRLQNKAKHQWWWVAPDFETARQQSFAARESRKVENITLVGDQTEEYLVGPGGESLRLLLESGAHGRAWFTTPSYTAAQVLSRKPEEPLPPTERRWQVTPVL